MLSNCKDAMDNSPIIAAIKDMAGLKNVSPATVRLFLSCLETSAILLIL